MEFSKTRYAKSGGVSIAYKVGGEGPDLVIVPGWVSHVELMTEHPTPANFLRRLMSFSRVIMFDKRGTGMSDPVTDVPTLEHRMEDITAVLDAVGVERAAIFGLSEGAPLSILFAAAHPERTTSLVLYGAVAKSTWAPDFDHPFAPRLEDILRAHDVMLGPMLEGGDSHEVFAPSFEQDPSAGEWFDKLFRYGTTPAMLEKLFEMYYEIDVRAALPSIQCPTLVLHRRGDRVINRHAGIWVAEHIAGARYIELPGSDHVPFAGDVQPMLDEVQEFVTGHRGSVEADRVLAAVMFTDIVDSTVRASEAGDSRWRDVLDQHDALTRKHVEAARGRIVKHTGDGTLAVFDGPGRAIRCARAVLSDVRSLGIELRAGVHTGEIELRGEDVGGIAVHIASRISGLADANEIVASRTVKDLVAGSGIVFEDHGLHTLKGVPGEWQVYTVAGG
jgi:pimeloyl-ACP methyl ester carboxylesterase